jgi:membrane protease YdiL (CAAX protease family)
MDVATPQPTDQLTAGAEPAFQKRWNGWMVLWTFLTLALLFILVQTMAAVLWVELRFPEILQAAAQGNVGPLQELRTSAGLARLLTPTGLLAIQAPTTLVMVPATIGLAHAWLGVDLADLGFTRTLRGSTALKAVGAGAGLFVVSIVLAFFQDRILGSHPQEIALIIAKHHGLLAITLDLLSAAVLAPLFEETLFRGVVFTALVQRIRFPLAAALSGLAFGLAHADLYNVIVLAVVGMGLAYVFYYSRTIWASMIAHGTFNSMSLILPLIFPQLNS